MSPNVPQGAKPLWLRPLAQRMKSEALHPAEEGLSRVFPGSQAAALECREEKLGAGAFRQGQRAPRGQSMRKVCTQVRACCRALGRGQKQLPASLGWAPSTTKMEGKSILISSGMLSDLTGPFLKTDPLPTPHSIPPMGMRIHSYSPVFQLPGMPCLQAHQGAPLTSQREGIPRPRDRSQTQLSYWQSQA